MSNPWRRLLLLVLGSALLLPAGSAGEWTPERIQARIQQIKNSDTTAWRRIPWTRSLLDARQASQKERRPLFLFTHDGNISTGRC